MGLARTPAANSRKNSTDLWRDSSVVEGQQEKGRAWSQDLDLQEGHHRRAQVPPKAIIITKSRKRLC